MNIHFLITALLNHHTSSKREPVRLEKKTELTTFEMVCHKICPYVIIICLLILGVLLFLVLVKKTPIGKLFSTFVIMNVILYQNHISRKI